MKPDILETRLRSVQEGDYYYEISLILTAYLRSSQYFNENTIVFDCEPRGSNYHRAYFEAEFEGPEQIAQIHEFLADHFSRGDDNLRELTLPIESGNFILGIEGGEDREIEDFDEITIRGDGNKITFAGPVLPSPNIHTYERLEEGEPQDARNATKLLEFFDEVGSDDAPRNIALELHDGELIEKCLPKLRKGDYSDAARSAGIILEERVEAAAPSTLDYQSGADLMKKMFKKDGVVQLSHEEGEQEGLMFLFAGAYQAIRNPLSHRHPDPKGGRYLDDLDEVQTRNILHLVDFLLTVLERSRRTTE